MLCFNLIYIYFLLLFSPEITTEIMTDLFAVNHSEVEKDKSCYLNRGTELREEHTWSLRATQGFLPGLPQVNKGDCYLLECFKVKFFQQIQGISSPERQNQFRGNQ